MTLLAGVHQAEYKWRLGGVVTDHGPAARHATDLRGDLERAIAADVGERVGGAAG